MKKLSKVAKKVKGDKKFKKLIADFLSDVQIRSGSYDLKMMLTVGFRGWLARTEDELCDEFDRVVLEIQEGKLKVKPLSGWGTGEKEREDVLAVADRIYDEIFERIILRGGKPSGRKDDEGTVQGSDSEGWDWIPS
jgi:hypothetical protein